MAAAAAAAGLTLVAVVAVVAVDLSLMAVVAVDLSLTVVAVDVSLMLGAAAFEVGVKSAWNASLKAGYMLKPAMYATLNLHYSRCHRGCMLYLIAIVSG